MADSFTPRFKDLVRCYTTTVGTGDFTLGPALNGFSTFGETLQPGDSFYYSCVGIDKPAEREIGRGTLVNPTTVQRMPIGGVKTNFTKGNKAVALVAASEWFGQIDQSVAALEDQVSVLSAGGGGGQRQSVQIAEDLATLAALRSDDPAATLTEIGRDGAFRWDGSDQSALVAADPQRGIIVAPDADPSGASGAWVRQIADGIKPEWFGAKGDSANGVGTDDSAAFVAAIAAAAAVAKTGTLNPNYKGSGKISLEAKGYYLGTTTLDLVNNVIIEGVGPGPGNANSTVLRWAANTTGIRVLSPDSAIAASGTADPPHTSGLGSIIRNVMLYGGYAGTEGEYHGIHLRASAVIEDVRVFNFQGSGIHIVADVASPDTRGNANFWQVNRVNVDSCRDGIHVAGGDTNGGTAIGVIATSNRRWGIFDGAFLGNSWLGPLSEANGTESAPIPTLCTMNGRLYACRYGQEAGASVNAPSGTTENNTWWAYSGDGGAPNAAAWASGTVYRAGGAGCVPNPNSRSLVLGAYQEGAQGVWQTASNVLMVGGLSGSVGPRIQAAGDQVVVYGYQGLKANKLQVTGEVTLAGGTTSETITATGGKRFSIANGSYVGAFYKDNSGRSIVDSYNLSSAQYEPVVVVAQAFDVDLAGNGVVLRADQQGLRLWKGQLGYGQGVGNGGAAVQGTDKSTGVTLNKPSGQITMHNAALAPGSSVSFTLTNSTISPEDVVIVNLASGASADSYTAEVTQVATGSCRLQIRNVSASSLSEALVLNFALVKGASG